jgi:hypothetical protein
MVFYSCQIVFYLLPHHLRLCSSDSSVRMLVCFSVFYLLQFVRLWLSKLELFNLLPYLISSSCYFCQTIKILQVPFLLSGMRCLWWVQIGAVHAVAYNSSNIVFLFYRGKLIITWQSQHMPDFFLAITLSSTACLICIAVLGLLLQLSLQFPYSTYPKCVPYSIHRVRCLDSSVRPMQICCS